MKQLTTRYKALGFFYFLLFSLIPFATTAKESDSFDHSHSLFNKVLSEHLVFSTPHSRVNYKKLLANSQDLDQYLETLKSLKMEEFQKFSHHQQLAFLINTYNAFQLKQVILNYPIDSVRDISRFFFSPWKIKFFRLFGQKSSLDHIEHGRIRPIFKEPRIHFALNCASISCPPLLYEAYTAKTLAQQLNFATRNFLNDQSNNYYDEKSNTLMISSIFDWYEEDFGDNYLDFIAKHMKSTDLSALNLEEIKIGYTDYNWKLNEHK